MNRILFFLDKVFRSSIQALNESRNYMDHGKFLEAVHLMQGAKRIAFLWDVYVFYNCA